MIFRKQGMTGLLLAATLVATLAAPAIAQKKYDQGATDTEIKLGQTIPYSGPASNFSRIAAVELAYFKSLNDQGGINGRKINLLSVDDGYSPPKTVEVTRRLVESDGVLFIFNPFGSATSLATRGYLNQKKIPQLFVSSAASKFADPKGFPYTMGFAPSYYNEGVAYGKYVAREVKDPKIGVLYQNDEFGRDYLAGFKLGLGDKQAAIVKEVTYDLTDPSVESQIVTLQASGANVFFNVANGKFAVQAIRKAYDIGWKPLGIVTTGLASVNEVMKPAGLEKSKGVMSAVYLKDPTDPALAADKGVQDYLAFMKKYLPDADPADRSTVSGYSMAVALAHVLRECKDDLTRENVMRQMTSVKNLQLPMVMNGILFNTSPTHYAPLSQTQLVRFDGERFVKVGEIFSSAER